MNRLVSVVGVLVLALVGILFYLVANVRAEVDQLAPVGYGNRAASCAVLRETIPPESYDNYAPCHEPQVVARLPKAQP